jgi:archaellum biogenesis ATPase FlaH
MSDGIQVDSIPHFGTVLDTAIELADSPQQRGILTGFERIDSITDGMKEGLVLLMGTENVGKSALMQTLAMGMLINNNDTCWLHLSLDDPARQTIYRIMASREHVPINAMADSIRYSDEVYVRARMNARSWIRSYQNRIVMLDSSYDDMIGDSICRIENIAKVINWQRERLTHITEDHPDIVPKLIVTIDAFHNMVSKDPKVTTNEDYMGNMLKDLIPHNTIQTVLITPVHENKSESRIKRAISTDQIKGSSGMPYHANLILALHCEMNEKPDTDLFWVGADNPTHLPILETRVMKNKFSDHRGMVFFRFLPRTCTLVECTQEEHERYVMFL